MFTKLQKNTDLILLYSLTLSVKNIHTSCPFTIQVSLAAGRDGSEVQFKFTHCPMENSAGTLEM